MGLTIQLKDIQPFPGITGRIQKQASKDEEAAQINTPSSNVINYEKMLLSTKRWLESSDVLKLHPTHMVLRSQQAVQDVFKYGSFLIPFVSYEDCNTGLASFTFNTSKILHKSWKGPKY